MKNRIKELRELKGLSQADLAKRLNVSLHSVWRWENERVDPRASELSQMADVFECGVQDLFENPPQPPALTPEELGAKKEVA